MCECAAEYVPVSEMDHGEEDWPLLVPLLELGPLIGVGWVVASDCYEAVGRAEFVEADGVDHVLAVALELSSGEGGGVAIPVDVGQQVVGVSLGGVAASWPSEIDGVHHAPGCGVGAGAGQEPGCSAQGLVAEGQGVGHEY